MKVLLINGSPRPRGCTYTALNEVAKTLEQEGIETEIIQVGQKDIQVVLVVVNAKQMDNVFLMMKSM